MSSIYLWRGEVKLTDATEKDGIKKNFVAGDNDGNGDDPPTFPLVKPFPRKILVVNKCPLLLTTCTKPAPSIHWVKPLVRPKIIMIGQFWTN